MPSDGGLISHFSCLVHVPYQANQLIMTDWCTMPHYDDLNSTDWQEQALVASHCYELPDAGYMMPEMSRLLHHQVVDTGIGSCWYHCHLMTRNRGAMVNSWVTEPSKGFCQTVTSSCPRNRRRVTLHRRSQPLLIVCSQYQQLGASTEVSRHLRSQRLPRHQVAK